MRETLSKSSKTKGKAKTAVKSGGVKSAKKSAARPVTSVKKKAAKKPAVKASAKTPAKAVRPKAAKPVESVKKPAPKKASVKPAAKPAKAVKGKPVKSRAIPAAAKKPAVKAKGSAGKKAAKVKPVRRKKLALPLVITPAPLPPEPPRRQMSTAGLKAFEQAVKQFNRRQYPQAKAAFENLSVRFPQEVEIIARAQTYIHVCAQKMAHAKSAPRNPDELYDRGVFALNIGDFSQARSFFEKALRLKPDEPYLLYSLAATHAQIGAHDMALDYLKRSIQIQPRFRAQALNDNDFSGLRENKQFLELLGLASPFDLLEARK